MASLAKWRPNAFRGARSIHCHAGTAVLTVREFPIPRLHHVAVFRWHVIGAVPQGGLIGFAAMLALAGTALRLVLLSLSGIIGREAIHQLKALRVDTAALTVRDRSGGELYSYCRALGVQCLRLKHWTLGRERPGQQVILMRASDSHCLACRQCTDINQPNYIAGKSMHARSEPQGVQATLILMHSRCMGMLRFGC